MKKAALTGNTMMAMMVEMSMCMTMYMDFGIPFSDSISILKPDRITGY